MPVNNVSIDLVNKPFLNTLASSGIELDQRMRVALDLACLTIPEGQRQVKDSNFLIALCRLNSIVARHISIDDVFWKAIEQSPSVSRVSSGIHSADSVLGGAILTRIANRALAEGRSQKVLGTHDFLKALIEDSLDIEQPAIDSFSRDLLRYLFPGPQGEMEIQRLLYKLQDSIDGTEDFQYILTFSEDRVAFRVVSVLDDYVQQTAAGIYTPQRALLTHFKDQFGGFTSDEIEELEALLNSAGARENDFQRFFERHPHFLRQWDHREVHSQVVLTRPEGPLVPDFILTNRELQRAAILDLKLPTAKLVRRQHNRDRFAASLSEAKTQLLRYRDWFRERQNRLTLKNIVGMEIYEPHLIVAIGRSSEFQDAFDRQLLAADNRDISIVTYDDILAFASHRRMVIEGR
ncbi:MAG TPA: Shedu anti-phage system protein SduA domain-containing protein [Pyrinomonadaceae bacterium]|nr:Shedu anti-phage system protein SduA domain-containing protein [Pyrinomonadaceae bacterium]